MLEEMGQNGEPEQPQQEPPSREPYIHQQNASEEWTLFRRIKVEILLPNEAPVPLDDDTVPTIPLDKPQGLHADLRHIVDAEVSRAIQDEEAKDIRKTAQFRTTRSFIIRSFYNQEEDIRKTAQLSTTRSFIIRSFYNQEGLVLVDTDAEYGIPKR